MPSIVELAELSNYVYEDGGDAQIEMQNSTVLWERSASWSNRLGFYASIFTNGPESVLAFRGTDDLKDVLIDDAAIAAGTIPPQVIAALAVSGQLSQFSGRWVTGHSLGGALALIVAARRNLGCVSFNAPGVMDSCVQTSVLTLTPSMAARCAVNGNVYNIRIAMDAVSSRFTTGAQVGSAGGVNRTYTAPQCGMNLLCRHGIDACISAVRRHDENFQPLP